MSCWCFAEISPTQTTEEPKITDYCEAEVATTTVDGETFANFHLDQSTPSKKANQAVLTNTYTNTFTLSAKKVSSKTGAALTGASFELYGPYLQSNNTTKYITYTDSDGSTKNLYYINTSTAASNPAGITGSGVAGEDGIAQFVGASTSDDNETYLYAVKEIVAPYGYKISRTDYTYGVYGANVMTGDPGENEVTFKVYDDPLEGMPLYVRKQVDGDSNFAQGARFTQRVTLAADKATTTEANYTYRIRVYDADGNIVSPTYDEETGEMTYSPVRAGANTTVDYLESYTAFTAQCSVDNSHGGIDVAVFDVDLEDGWYIKVLDVPLDYSYQVCEPDALSTGDTVTSESYFASMANPNATEGDGGTFDNASNTYAGTIHEVDDAEGKPDPSSEYNTVQVTNYQNVEDVATSTAKVAKTWASDAVDTKNVGEVTMTLYQVVRDGDGNVTSAVPYPATLTYAGVTTADNVSTVTMSDGTKDASGDAAKWAATWSNLPLYGVSDNKVVTYDYYIGETENSIYTSAYSGDATTLTLSDGSAAQVKAAVATNGILSIDNSMTWYKLPSTGGMGSVPYAIVGGLMVVISGVLLLRRRYLSKKPATSKGGGAFPQQ